MEVDEGHDYAAGPAAEPAGEESQQGTDHGGQGDHHGDGEERDASAVDQAAESVAAEIVGAERVFEAAFGLEERGLQASDEVESERVFGRDLRTEDAEDEEEQEDGEGDAQRLRRADAPAAAAGGKRRLDCRRLELRFRHGSDRSRPDARIDERVGDVDDEVDEDDPD